MFVLRSTSSQCVSSEKTCHVTRAAKRPNEELSRSELLRIDSERMPLASIKFPSLPSHPWRERGQRWVTQGTSETIPSRTPYISLYTRGNDITRGSLSQIPALPPRLAFSFDSPSPRGFWSPSRPSTLWCPLQCRKAVVHTLSVTSQLISLISAIWSTLLFVILCCHLILNIRL